MSSQCRCIEVADGAAASTHIDRMHELATMISDVMSWEVEWTARAVEAEYQHTPPGEQPVSRVNEPGGQSAVADARTLVIRSLLAETSDARQGTQAAVETALERRLTSDGAVAGMRGMRVLEYGGAGSVALRLADRCRQVVVYHDTESVREFVERRARRAGARIAVAADLGVYQAEFDAVLALAGVGPVSEIAAQLEELVRLVKPGGLAVLGSTVNDQELDGLERLMEKRGCLRLESLDSRVGVFVKGPAVTVIVPVYNAREHISALLDSIRATHPGYPVRWQIVDDHSTDPEIAPLLDAFAAEAPETCSVEHSATNLGFVGTCNGAMQATGRDDLILLNSDTRVCDGWVRRLVEAAYAAPEIATVTPLSNNGSAFSVLRGIDAQNRVSEVLATASRPLIDIPTGVGFCLYIKREVLDRVGLFDPVFGVGYGEETDFCQRALQAGYRHVLSPNVFIFHATGASMVEAGVIAAGKETLEAHARVLSERYFDFDERVQRFMASGIVDRLSADIAKRYVTQEAARRPSITFVTHTNVFKDFIGGTEYHLRDLMRELGREYVFYVLHPGGGGISVSGAVDGAVAEVHWQSDDYDALLADLNPSLVHIHHLRGFAGGFIDALARWGGPKLFTVHDFNALCPSITLLNAEEEFCGVPARALCDRCAAELFAVGAPAVVEQRARHQRLVDTLDCVLAPSQAALQIFRRGIRVPEQRTQVVPHAVVKGAYSTAGRRQPTGALTPRVEECGAEGDRRPLTVGFIGYNAAHKGGALIRSLVAACVRDEVRFVAVGEIADSVTESGRVSSTGRYRREEVVELIRRAGIDVMAITSPWAETYSFTVTESWLAGVPVLVGPLGAPAERVRQMGAGVVLPHLQVEEVAGVLRKLASDAGELARLKQAAVDAAGQLPRDYQMYARLYAELAGTQGRPTEMFSGAGAQQGLIEQEVLLTPLPPIITKLVQVRKLLIPVGSRRERLYFKLHNLVTPVYAGGATR